MISVFLCAFLFIEPPVACQAKELYEGKPPPKTNISLGELIGTTYITYSGRPINAFYGIPYAKPPVGELRFEPPQPITTPWAEPRIANKKSEQCVQPQIPLIFLSTGSEDCLYADVYTPLVPMDGQCEKYLPVMFYIHPSVFLFSSGTNNEPYFIMDTDKRDIVFVTFNYRLGLLGYFATGDLIVPGNNGQKDQVMAMRWTKENARSFCGDPDQITIVGSSSGGISVGIHTFSPLTKGLFNKAISVSGNPYFASVYRPLIVDFGKIIAEQMGCRGQDSKTMVECLKTKPAYAFWKYEMQFRPFFFLPLLNFALIVEPCHEGAYITKIPEVYFEEEEIYEVPTLAMLSEFEGSLVQPFYLFPGFTLILDLTYRKNFQYIYDYNQTTPLDEFVTLAESIMQEYYKNGTVTFNEYGIIKSVTDRFYFFSNYHHVLDLARRNSNKPTYYLEYAYVEEDSLGNYFNPIRNFGAAHCDAELLVIFDGWYQKKHPLNSEDTKMKEFMSDLYYSFMVDGKPSKAEELGWEPVPASGNTIKYLRVNGPDDMKIKESDDYGDQQFWQNIPRLPNRGFPYADSCNKTRRICYHKG